MPPKIPPSLAAVARAAGVSPSTVSRALSGHRLLNPATVEPIRAVAARPGYRANPLLSKRNPVTKAQSCKIGRYGFRTQVNINNMFNRYNVDLRPNRATGASPRCR